MRLFITDTPTDKLDSYSITIDQFNDISYHPYLKTMKLESVIVDLDDRIKRSYLKQVVLSNNNVVPRLISNEITPKQILLLIEMFPDDAAQIYKWTQMSNDEKLDAFNSMCERKNWKLEY